MNSHNNNHNEFHRNMKRINREKLLFLYTRALERGDFNAINMLLRRAQDDDILAEQMRELDEWFAAESAVELGQTASQYQPKAL